MKNLRHLAILIAVIFVSCQPSPQKQIQGKWKVKELVSTQEIPEMFKAMYEQQLQEFKDKSLFDFRADGSYTAVSPSGEIKGKWSYDKTNKLLIFVKDSVGNSDTTQVLSIKKDEIVYTITKNDHTSTVTLSRVKN